MRARACRSARRSPLPRVWLPRVLVPIIFATLASATTTRAQAAQSSGSTDSTRSGRPVVRSLLGDLALEIRVTGPGSLSIGAADASRAITLDVRSSDARRWIDSASRIVARPVRRVRAVKGKGTPPAVRYRALLEEPGTGQGSFILSRVDSAGKASYVLFAADAELAGVRQPLAASEAALLVRLVRRAVDAATPPKPRRAAPRPKGTVKSAPSKVPPKVPPKVP